MNKIFARGDGTFDAFDGNYKIFARSAGAI